MVLFVTMSYKSSESDTKPHPAFDAAPPTTPGYYSLDEVAEILNINPETLARMRRAGDGPPCIKVTPHLVRYPIREFHEWLKSREVVSAPDVPRLAPPVHMSKNDSAAFARPKPAVPTGGDAA